jgi:cytochrome c-type biogenesis protein CcsB
MEEERKQYIQNIFSILNEESHASKFLEMNEVIHKMQKYQLRYGAASIPSATRLKAERIYNRIPFATILFMMNLTLGFLCLFVSVYQLTRRQVKPSKWLQGWNIIALILMGVSFLALTFALVLRWIVSGTVPMSNGYETMLFMAWSVMLLVFVAYRRFHIVLTFGFLMSGFFLLVSHISQMDPQITHLMPVLVSPLLSIHVSVIMMSYALLSLTFICGLMALFLRMVRGKHAPGLEEQLQALQLLSRLFLYPAITTLGLGIFIGAIWANVSWGTYWSWDPKETWALITLMVYAVALHTRSVPVFAKPLNYHIFMTFAFLTMLMTYFGVNYFLGGMHSYA